MSEERKEAIENIKAIVLPSKGVEVEKVTMYKECIQDIIKILNLIEKQEKVIDEMANKIQSEGVIWYSPEEVKQYFYRKVEE